MLLHMGQKAVKKECMKQSYCGDLVYKREHSPKHEGRIQTYLFSACACDELFYLHTWVAEFHS